MVNSIIDFDKPTRCIVHFKAQETTPLFPYYQVTIDPDPSWYSPSGEFIRFDQSSSEIHGWRRVDDIVIDEVLAYCVSDEGEEEVWKAA